MSGAQSSILRRGSWDGPAAARQGRAWLLPALCLLSLNAASPSGPAGRQESPLGLPGPPWTRHAIDDSSRGADGVRLADVNGDGRLDIVTGWEEGGVVRVYLNPGPSRSKQRWPAVTVGTVGSPEDAVFADLDGDGVADVVSSCEGRVRTLFAHWAPREKGDLLRPEAWRTEAFPALQGRQMMMFALPLQVDGQRGIDLVCGSKEAGAEVGWLESPPAPRDMAAWRWHPLCPAGWVMTLQSRDMDEDGDPDLLISDRKGPTRGCHWLENPGPERAATAAWRRHTAGGAADEVMFMRDADLDQDGRIDLVTPVKDREVLFLRRRSAGPDDWEPQRIPFPAATGRAKGIAVGDLDADGRSDLVLSCESAGDGRSGVFWMKSDGRFPGWRWTGRDISGTTGVKYDDIRLLDLDGDGDLDVLTCEERTNLGVIWYENPLRR